MNLHTRTHPRTLSLTVRTIHHSASSAPASALSTKQPSNPLQPPQASSVTGSVPRCSVPRSVQFSSIQFSSVQFSSVSVLGSRCSIQRRRRFQPHKFCAGMYNAPCHSSSYTPLYITPPLPCMCSPFCIYSIIMRSVCCQNLLPKRKVYFIKHRLFLEVLRHLCSPRACMNECAPERARERVKERGRGGGEYVSLGLLSHRYWKRRRS